ncbi:MAG: DNA internalization-related competence protein ComEC/Rec2 [Phycisphaerales bacterium]
MNRAPFGIVAAVAFGLGIACADHLHLQTSAAFLMLAAMLVANIGLCLHRRRRSGQPRATRWLLAACVLLMGAGWYGMRTSRVAPDDIIRMLPATGSHLVRVRGIITQPPVLRPVTQGAMSRFEYREPSTFFEMRITAILDEQRDTEVRASGRVLVQCAETLPPAHIGDEVVAAGRISRFAGPQNPGEFDRAAYAVRRGQSGQLTVAERELIDISSPHADGEAHVARNIFDSFANCRDQLRDRASDWLASDLPAASRDERRALLQALLLGERESALEPLTQSFRRVGLSHLLAISGLHLDVLAGLAVLLLRATTGEKRWHGLFIIALIAIYLFLIEVRLPVLRAAIMTSAACLGLLLRRHILISGLVALSGLAILIWQPFQIFDPGFQLSYAVTLGLILFATRMRNRWFFNTETISRPADLVLEWMRMLVAASVTAWLISLPIVAFHFTIVTPLAPVMGVIALPVVVCVLALGYLKLTVGVVLPSLGAIITLPLSVVTDLLVAIVNAVDTIAFASIEIAQPSVLWALTAMIIAVAWLSVRLLRWSAALLVIATIAITAWLFAPVWRVDPPLRIDMLAVGNGSCYLIRSERSRVLFDAGSISDLDVTQRVILPALKHLGVTRLDAVVISHANLDHYGGVLDLADRIPIGRVVINTHFQTRAAQDALGPAAFLLDELAARIIHVEVIDAPHARVFGACQWTWLWPPADSTWHSSNDESSIIQISVAGRRVLLCGDASRPSLASLQKEIDSNDLRSDVLELPHHGSFNVEALALVKLVQPRVVMQSTGSQRLERDAWAAHLEEPPATLTRLITARDGTCTIIIEDDGGLTVTKFVE